MHFFHSMTCQSRKKICNQESTPDKSKRALVKDPQTEKSTEKSTKRSRQL